MKSEASEISVISRPFVYEDGRKRLLQTYNTENLKATFARLGMKRSHDLAASRNNLSTFATAMAERVAVHEDTEDKKLKLENEKFEYIKQLEKQKLELELAKVRNW